MKYPMNTTTVIKLDHLIKRDKLSLAERMSSRMVKCASVIDSAEFIGWQMTVPTDDVAEIEVFGSSGICQDDLEWTVEKMAKSSPGCLSTSASPMPPQVYELSLPIGTSGGIGFGAATKSNTPVNWPTAFFSGLEELLRVLRLTGAAFRAVVGPATTQEQESCRKETLRSWAGANVSVDDYIGRPVKARALLRLHAAPSARLRAILEESIPGIRIQPVSPDTWEVPLTDSPTLPDYATRILMMEPRVTEATIGLEVCDEEMKPIPAGHKNTKAAGAVTIGRATETSGKVREITIGELDLRRHYQIVGQTGTGKSTLLANTILSAIEQGHGLTFFDPHGSTIDVVLRALPARYADRVRVVRIGDAEHPVPLNIWDSEDPEKEERTINDLCELFADIFDPRREGFVGPRWERWFSTFAKASIALLGRRASLESIAVLSRSQANMLKVYKAIGNVYPDLAETIKQEWGTDKSNDFQSTLSWFLCKFQRLTSVEQLRKTLGAGANALDFANTIDTDTVTLIDLASPVIGTHAARIIGTLQLMKLWNAAMSRKDRNKTHLVFVDEASLFQTNPMPRMLAESRKFGLAMVLCHQHTGQLTQDIRDALEANSANFSAFRLSTKDALSAGIRFDDSHINLTRLDAFKAITTLSVDGRQTAPFTLEIDKPAEQAEGEKIASEIERRSIQTMVRPYEDLCAMTAHEIQHRLNYLEEHPLTQRNAARQEETVWIPPIPTTDRDGYRVYREDERPDWLENWLARKAAG